jgi:hypothetical protein
MSSHVTLATDAVYDGGGNTRPLVKFIAIDTATSGAQAIIAAVTGYRIKVLAGLLVPAGSMTVKFTDGSGGTELTGAMSTIVGVPMLFPFCPLGHFQTSVGNALGLTLSAGTQVSGYLVYVLLPE